MTFLTAASIEDLVRQVAVEAMYLGRKGAVLDAAEVRTVRVGDRLREGGIANVGYERYECQLHHHWAALDEATRRPGVRQQQSAGGAR